MAEIRINATGGVKLYDADDSHYAQIVAGTISSNVDALVEAVVTGILTFKFSSMAMAGVVPTVEPSPISKSSAESSSAI